MSRYNLKFSKSGLMIYTSHLDMQRLFKRAFKRAGIALAYSQGFNPHPLMSFAQPLSLGYFSVSEFLEFKTKEDHSPAHIAAKLNEVMPDGLEITDCSRMTDKEKNLASRCTAAEYLIEIDLHKIEESFAEDIKKKTKEYLDQDEIAAKKHSKKKKEPVIINIRPKIKEIRADFMDGKIIMTTKLDAGSESNLSPELLLDTFLQYLSLDVPRENVDISRLKLIFK